jgi:hypothetical protein
MKWTPDQVTAAIIVVGCIVLIATGIDGQVKAILGMAAGWLFGGQYQARKASQGGK